MTDKITEWQHISVGPPSAKASIADLQSMIDVATLKAGKPRFIGVTVNGVEQVMVPKALYDEWVAAQDDALNWADANARWFDISTAPWLKDVDSEYDYRSPDSGNGIGQVYKTDLFDDDLGEWLPDVHVGDVFYQRNGAVSKPTHWRPIQNPPPGQLPAPLERLGEVLRKVKGSHG